MFVGDPATLPDKVSSTDTSNGKKRVLVVDDVEDYTRLVKLTMEATGEYEVLVHSDPTTVVSTAKEYGPHVILLDVIMPGMDGTEVARDLMADPDLHAVTIVFLTASVEPQMVDGRPTFNGLPCLSKPAAIDDILEVIDDSLGS